LDRAGKRRRNIQAGMICQTCISRVNVITHHNRNRLHWRRPGKEWRLSNTHQSQRKRVTDWPKGQSWRSMTIHTWRTRIWCGMEQVHFIQHPAQASDMAPLDHWNTQISHHDRASNQPTERFLAC
jgi:hypothetical protein